MRVTPRSTLAISICALALLSQISSVHPVGGFFEDNGNYPITTSVQRYVMEHQKELGLSNIRWGGGNDHDLSLARVTWNKHDALMKCNKLTSEVDAFEALVKAKNELKGVYATGRQNIMDPLHQFGFSESNGNRYFCHLYSYINGVLLDDYFRKHTISQAYILASEILHEIIKGLIYLYNAGILHYDLHQRNIVIQLDSNRRIVGVKIIDLDATIIYRKPLSWRPINPNNEEYASLNPRQNYESCHGLKDEIMIFLELFVSTEIGNPFDPNYQISERYAKLSLERFKQSQASLERTEQERSFNDLELGDAKAAIPSIRYLLKMHYTMQSDKFACTSPIRVLRGLPPRTH